MKRKQPTCQAAADAAVAPRHQVLLGRVAAQQGRFHRVVAPTVWRLLPREESHPMHCRPFSYVRIDGVVTLLQCEPPLLSPPGADLRSSGPKQLAYLKCLENYRMLQFVTSSRPSVSTHCRDHVFPAAPALCSACSARRIHDSFTATRTVVYWYSYRYRYQASRITPT